MAERRDAKFLKCWSRFPFKCCCLKKMGNNCSIFLHEKRLGLAAFGQQFEKSATNLILLMFLFLRELHIKLGEEGILEVPLGNGYFKRVF